MCLFCNCRYSPTLRISWLWHKSFTVNVSAIWVMRDRALFQKQGSGDVKSCSWNFLCMLLSDLKPDFLYSGKLWYVGEKSINIWTTEAQQKLEISVMRHFSVWLSQAKLDWFLKRFVFVRPWWGLRIIFLPHLLKEGQKEKLFSFSSMYLVLGWCISFKQLYW